jgi:aminoglycoside phosphotransferase family enzyme
MDDRLRFLRSLAAHAGHVGPRARVQTIETHMSWVFLVDEQVLKLKKAARSAVLDFSTPAQREFHCREELRLNTRLAPGVYRGLKVLHWDGQRLALFDEAERPASGQVLDWLVCMHRLPRDRMLDVQVARGTLEASAVDALAEVLNRFYRQAPVQAVDAAEYVARMARQQRMNRELLAQPRFAWPGLGATLDAMDAALERQAPALRARAQQGHIVEGHGDLRPEHVCLIEPPVIIDALEFNLALRQTDPLDELAFLGMECEVAGAAWVGAQLLRRHAQSVEPGLPAALPMLYAALRALLRARLALAHLLEPNPRRPAHWRPAARRYVACAAARLEALQARSQLA